MAPSPQLSLCIPVSSNSHLIQEFSDNVGQFFQKFPLLYEVLFAVNPGQDQGLTLLQKLSEQDPRYQIVENKAPLTRAQNFEKLFKEAHGNILIATDLDLAVPLSEIFKILEVFFSDPEVDVVFGDRSKSKKKFESIKAPDDKMENFFKGVILEKTAWPFRDPFCPILGFRKTAFEKIQSDLKSTGWHWNHEIQRVTQQNSLKSQEIPIYVGSRKIAKPEGTAALAESLRLFKFVLVRI